MQKLTLIALALLAFASCRKDSSKTNLEVPSVYFYRLGIEDLDGEVAVSKIVPARLIMELTNDSNPGTGNGGNGEGQDNHYEGDGCNENTPRFCEKHPWHKKCTGLILPLTLEYFGVQVVNNHAVLSWKPLIEEQVSRYFIQRSTDGASFKNVGFVEPKGAFTTYKYTD